MMQPGSWPSLVGYSRSPEVRNGFTTGPDFPQASDQHRQVELIKEFRNLCDQADIYLIHVFFDTFYSCTHAPTCRGFWPT